MFGWSDIFSINLTVDLDFVGQSHPLRIVRVQGKGDPVVHDVERHTVEGLLTDKELVQVMPIFPRRSSRLADLPPHLIGEPPCSRRRRD